MVNDPIDSGNKDAAKQCRQGPQAAAHEERLAVDEAPKVLCVLEHRQGETDVDDCCENPQRKDPNDASTKKEITRKGIEGEVYCKVWLGAKAVGAAGVTRRSSSLQRLARRRLDSGRCLGKSHLVQCPAWRSPHMTEMDVATKTEAAMPKETLETHVRSPTSIEMTDRTKPAMSVK